MFIPNTNEYSDVAYIASTMVIEGMPLIRKDIADLMRVARGETTTEQLRSKILAQIRYEKLKEYVGRYILLS